MGLEGVGAKARAALLVCLAGFSLVARQGWAQAAAATTTAASPGHIAMMEARLADWPQLARYRAANAALAPAAKGENRVVFYGASMTEFWGKYGTKFFPGKPYVNRGISGQTTAQMVVRFRQDVIDLHPKVVVILAGTNDVAGNTGPMTPEMTENNWQSMADLAKVNGIRVIFASITPSTDFWWRKGLKPAEKIRALNAWLKGYCESHGLTYLDYYSALADEEGGMKKEFTVDGVHASAKGYAVMEPLAQAAIDKALAD
jgi:lysophospholipase L1-like esterase